MADLPRDRTECAPPFSFTGCDVFGPFNITDGQTTRRSNSSKKCWGVLFTCLNSRATHIEPLPHLDTTSMKNAIRRFICIRDPCKRLRSDHGTNFIGVKNQEACIDPEELSREVQKYNCEWELTPPKASHFGGIWERQIQTIKKILQDSLLQLGSRTLCRDELYTYLAECSSIMNNTPLWEYSSDPNDPRPLTPSMILNLREDPPASDHFSEKDFLSYGSKRWRRVQALADVFWRRWRLDYLQTLQSRCKWLKPTRSFKLGDVVLLRDASCKRHLWPIGKVSSVKLSPDGLVRSVTVVVSSRDSSVKTLCRPISELVLLIPVDGLYSN